MFILIRMLIGGEFEEIIISLFFIVCIFIGIVGVFLFLEYFFIVYCKFNFKEFYIEE